jgi:hypothetical protein
VLAFHRWGYDWSAAKNSQPSKSFYHIVLHILHLRVKSTSNLQTACIVYVSLQTVLPSKSAWAITIPTYIWEAPSLNLPQHTNYLESFTLLHTPSRWISSKTVSVTKLSTSFQIYYSIPHHLMLHSLLTYSIINRSKKKIITACWNVYHMWRIYLNV